MSLKTKSFIWGSMASFGLIFFYSGILLLTMPNVQAAWLVFTDFWHLIVILIIGFGTQVGLAIYLKGLSKQAHHLGKVSSMSGTVSGVSMVACCAHHLVDFLPFLGLLGLASFLGRYQKLFLEISVMINLLSLAYMLKLYQRHQKQCLINSK